MRLYLEDLKKFVLDQSGRNQFRSIMRVVREKASKKYDKGPKDVEYSRYLPLNFEAMMQYLHYTNERAEISATVNLNHRELLDKIERGADFEKEPHKIRPAEECRKDLEGICGLMASHTFDNSSTLHADGNMFCQNLSQSILRA